MRMPSSPTNTLSSTFYTLSNVGVNGLKLNSDLSDSHHHSFSFRDIAGLLISRIKA